jgi:unsaturated rhamnogalacturonyl hydrolase
MTSQHRGVAALFTLLLAGILAPASRADDADRNPAVLAAVREFAQPGHIELPIGVTPRGTLIWCLVPQDAIEPSEGILRHLIVAGLDGNPTTVETLQTHRDTPLLGRDGDMPGTDPPRRAWIPIANPDAWYDCVHHAADPKPLKFPPQGSAYNTSGEVESAVLTRFVEWFAPDAVIEITPANDPELQRTLESKRLFKEINTFAAQTQGLGGAGRVQVRAAWLPADLLSADWASLPSVTRSWTQLDAALVHQNGPSPTAAAACARLERPPLEVARRLLDHYGHELKTAMYQPALALVARLRYSDLTHDDSHREAVGRILAPYLSGQRAPLDDKSNGSHFAGQLIFAAWSDASDQLDPPAIEFVKAAADRAFDASGRPREAMPTHNEMSDAVFMACPILTAAGRLTGDPKYLDMAGRHLTFMQQHCLRDDGLYRHSPLCETPWGRGNGFPALGLALSLTELDRILNAADSDPPSTAKSARLDAARKLREQMLASFRAHLHALLAYQDPTGCWRQVIDHPGAYRELTATCMITVALARGLRHGWLDEDTYRPAVDRAWRAIQLRTYDDGVLLDVCTGTGKQKSLQDYLDREAILGRDERGGAMALMAAIEMADLQATAR